MKTEDIFYADFFEPKMWENRTSIALMEEINIRFLEEDTTECPNCRLIFASIWIMLTITGLLGNGLVVFTIIKFNKLTNVTQCYLFNLACADIAFIVSCIPLTTYSYLMERWTFGNLMCKVYHYTSFVREYFSIWNSFITFYLLGNCVFNLFDSNDDDHW